MQYSFGFGAGTRLKVEKLYQLGFAESLIHHNNFVLKKRRNAHHFFFWVKFPRAFIRHDTSSFVSTLFT
jgi:hypothetical protein